MYLELILAIIIFRYLRKYLHTKTLLPVWDNILFAGILFSISLLVIETTVHGSRNIVMWITHAMLLTLIFIIFYKKEFQTAKSIVYAIIPFIIINFAADLVELINIDFYKKWGDYFDMASFFSIIWMIAILIINNKQKKALEKERLKTEEIEKESKITERLKAALEIQVAERTAALTLQKEELQLALNELKSTQAQLIQSEKMASLGELTAGIAHEIQNPLNFVNNFSEVNKELLSEMNEEIQKGNYDEVKVIAKDITENEEKINHHGKRADAIVKGMLQHSRSSSGVKEPTDINALADEYLRLAYHGLRAKDKSFNATMKTDFDESIGNINIIPQDIGRVILNLITNAFFAVDEKKKQQLQGYEPTVSVSTKLIISPSGGPREAQISVKDNGNGIPQNILDKIFQPFFTTKPTGQGTGLGLSMSYDIIKAHGGVLKVENLSTSSEGKQSEGAQFIIILPV